MDYRLILVFISAYLFLCGSSDANSVDLQQLIESHVSAVGGKEALKAIDSVEISLRIEEPTFQVDAVYVADRKMRMRIDIYSDGKRVYTEAYNGKKGWQQSGDSEPPRESSSEGTAALWHGIVLPGKLFELHELASLGHKLELAGREIVDKVNYFVLTLTLSDGFVTYLYIHPDTWMIERRRDVRALHPDVDPKQKWIENRFADFRKVDGIVRSFASSQVDLKTGEVMQTTKMKHFKTNVVLDASIFEMPKSPAEESSRR